MERMVNFIISDRVIGIILFVLSLLFIVFDNSSQSVASSPTWVWITLSFLLIARNSPITYRFLFLGVAIGLAGMSVWGGASNRVEVFFSAILSVDFF
ncbi:hypothetical protein, partial [Piscirickettsia litoralis]|uniref:hypothetical protein n=1 Tax=Piscirickettsia litoralis TaxID=1891921 RepID=UPI0013016689